MKSISLKAMFVCSLILALVSGCKKETPVTTDDIDPKMQILITGSGVNKTFYNTEDYHSGQLNLKTNTTYNFILTISDAGGVELLKQHLSGSLVNSDLHVFGVPTPVEYVGIVYNTYTITGNRTDPYTGFVITGSFKTPVSPNVDLAVELTSTGRDYTPNQVTIFIPVLITDTPTGGYGWVEF